MSVENSETESSIAPGASAIRDVGHFEFSVPSSGIAVVANTRHDPPTTYAINVAESGETTACSCKADEYYPGECKHRRAVSANEAVILAATAERERAREHETTVKDVQGFGVEECERCGERAHIGRMSEACETSRLISPRTACCVFTLVRTPATTSRTHSHSARTRLTRTSS